MSDEKKVGLTDLDRKLDVLYSHATELHAEASAEAREYLSEITRALNRYRDEPSMYGVIYNAVINKFATNGRLEQQFPADTIGDRLTGCTLYGAGMPSNIRACMRPCQDGVKPPKTPNCSSQVWEIMEGGQLRRTTGDARAKSALVVLPGRKRDLSDAERARLKSAGVTQIQILTIDQNQTQVGTPGSTSDGSGASGIWVIMLLVLLLAAGWWWQKCKQAAPAANQQL